MSAAAEPIILFDQVNKWYGDNFHVLRDIDLQVKQGERIVICGPSGSGKSTLIRCVNRLEEHQQGRLVVDGTELTDDVKAIERVRKPTSTRCSSPAASSSAWRSRARSASRPRSCCSTSPPRRSTRR